MSAERHGPGSRAGPGALKFRVGTHPVFLRHMLARMQQPILRLPDGVPLDNILQALNPHEEDAFVPALLSAWATVADVLSFYQERIANEGYLATATESLSLHELARSIGYRPAPALSATTYLAFSVIDAVGAPTQLMVPRGTTVQSVPVPGDMPVTFETDADIDVRPEWNGMTPMLRRAAVAAQIVGGAKQLSVAGLIAALRPGMPLLLHDIAGPLHSEITATAHMTQMRTLTRIESNPVERTTLLGWDLQLEGEADRPLMEAPQALVFSQSATLFGATAPGWSRQPEAVKAQLTTRIGDVALSSLSDESWTPLGFGLPPGDVRALAIADDGMIVAAVGRQVVTRAGSGGWQATADLPQRSEPSALAIGADSRIYLGTQRGELLSSMDRGATWFNAGSPVGTEAPASERLPSIPIRTLCVAINADKASRIFAGTALGLWSTAPNGSGWTAWNSGLPGYDPTSGRAAAAVNDVTWDPIRDRWVVATEQGLLYAKSLGGEWRPATREPEPGVWVTPCSRLCQWIRQHARLPPPQRPAKPPSSAATPQADQVAPTTAAPPSMDAKPPAASALVLWAGDTGTQFFAATKQGIWNSTDGGCSWRPSSGQPGATGNAVSYLAAGPAGLLAGTDAGLFQSADAGETWSVASGPFAAQPVAALAVGSGLCVAAAPFGGYPGTEWPGFAVSGRQIDLDRTYQALVPGDWIVLAQPGSETGAPVEFAAARVSTASTVLRRDFLLNDRVTRVALDRELPHSFNPRTATVYLNSRALDAANTARHHVDVLGLDNSGVRPVEAPIGISLAGSVGFLKDRLISITGRRAGARFNASGGGVRKWDGQRWIKLGSFDNDGWTLCVGRDGTILLGTNNGVQRFDSERWDPLGDLHEQVHVIAEAADGEFFAGTQNGLWRWKDATWTLSALSGRRVTALLFEGGGDISAGSDGGLDRSTDGGATWQTVRKLPGLAITALARTRAGRIVAGTDRDGLLIAAADDWHNATLALRGHAVHALARNDAGQVFAATGDGIFRSTDGEQWSIGRVDRDQGDVRALAFDPRSDDLYFARRGVGVISRGQTLWAGLANDIRSLAFDRNGAVLASSLTSTVLLGADDTQAAVEPQFVADIGDDLVQRLRPGRLASDLRHIFLEAKISLSEKAEVSVLKSKLKWRVTDGKTYYILHALSAGSVRVFVEGDLEVLAWPQPVPGRDDLEVWRVANKDNVVANLYATRPPTTDGSPRSGRGEIVFTSAAAAHSTIGEVRAVREAIIAGDRSRTDLMLSQALDNVYDAATVTCNANVAPASHGETPALYEVVGSGDASIPNQSFTLNRKPMTVRPSATGSWDYGIVVRVRGSFQSEPLILNEQLVPDITEEEAVEWRCVETLTLSGPSDLHYLLQEGPDGTITLVFGDGKHGKRLPTGTENVIALYRTGSGPIGNVEAGRLTLLRKRPAGIRKVTNPVAASGGTVSAIDASIRMAAPIAVRTLGRVVSMRDYHDFVRAWPGIAKVAVRSLSLPSGRRLIHITVADSVDERRVAGSMVEQPANAHSDLLEAILSRRTIDCAVRLDSYVPRWFRIEADVVVSEKERTTKVRSAITSMLLERYGFLQRSLGEGVMAMDATAAIQDVPGVQAVQLRRFHLLDWKPATMQILHAAEAHWAGAAVHPAELLLVGGEGNIVLGEMKS